jgi:hypothetical protein
MPVYISLFNWTDQGIRNARDLVRRPVHPLYVLQSDSCLASRLRGSAKHVAETAGGDHAYLRNDGLSREY